MSVPESCPSLDDLRALLAGQVSVERSETLGDHLDVCQDCRLKADALNWETHSPELADAGEAESIISEVSDRLRHESAGKEGDFMASFFHRSDHPGSMGRLANYEVLHEIARGGMGIVFKGRDLVLKRDVAIKVLAPELAVSAAAKRRFLREAQAAGAIEHANIMPIYLVERGAQLPFFVMCYNDGCSLEELVKMEGPLPLEEIRRIGVAVARGLEAAHAIGLVHRDIKPANILLSKDRDQVRITDFGLARIRDGDGITQPGALAGTPQYMAPEQIDGVALDHRADLFALGGVLYFMATGRPAFEGGNVTSILRQVCLEAPAPFDGAAAALPGWFRSLVLRLLAKVREERVQSASTVIELLSEQRAPASQRSAFPRFAWLGIAVALMLGIFFLWRDGERHAGFSVGRQGKTWLTLNAAIEAAGAGDTVIIHQDGLVPFTPVTVTRALRLQAAPKRSPRLVCQDTNRGHFVSTAPLVLEGVSLIQEVTDEKACENVILAQNSLLMSHCQIVRVWKGSERLLGGAAVIAFEGPRCIIQHSEVYAPSSVLLDSHGTMHSQQAIILENNALTGAFVVRAKSGAPLKNLQLDLISNNVLGGAFVAFGDPNPPYCYVNVRSNAVDVHTLFGGFMSWGEFVPCLSRVLWRGRENIYACTYYRTSFLNDQPKEAYQTNEIAEWEAVPTISERQVLEVERAIAEAVLPHDYVIKPERLQVEGRIDKEMMEMSAALRQRYPDRGMRSDLVGPGAGWDAWRATAATEPWEIAIAAQMNR